MDLRTRAAAIRHGRVYENVEPEFRFEQGQDGDSDVNSLVVSLPGFKKEELKVQVDNQGTLRVSGERQLQGNRWTWLRKDFPLPEVYDTTQIRAKFGDGILTIVLPKIVTAAAYPVDVEEQRVTTVPSGREGGGKRDERLPMSVPPAPVSPKEKEPRQPPYTAFLPSRSGVEGNGGSVSAGNLASGTKDRKQPPLQRPPSRSPETRRLGALLARDPDEKRAATQPEAQQHPRQTSMDRKSGKEGDGEYSAFLPSRQRPYPAPLPSRSGVEGKGGSVSAGNLPPGTRARKAEEHQPQPADTTKVPRKQPFVAPVPAHKAPTEHHQQAPKAPAPKEAQKEQPRRPIKDVLPNPVPQPTTTTHFPGLPRKADDTPLTSPHRVAEESVFEYPKKRLTESTHTAQRPTPDSGPTDSPMTTRKTNKGGRRAEGMGRTTSRADRDTEENGKLVTNIAVAMLVLLCFWLYVSYTFKNTN